MKKHKKHKTAVHRDSKVSTTTQTRRLDAWATR